MYRRSLIVFYWNDCDVSTHEDSKNILAVFWRGLVWPPFQSRVQPANTAKPAKPSNFIVPNGISCELSQLCPQRLMARVMERTGILPSLSGTESGWRRRDLFCDGKVCNAGVIQLAVLAIPSAGRQELCAQNSATCRGHYSNRLMPSLCVHHSRLRPNQTAAS